jgi:hypothetical protein
VIEVAQAVGCDAKDIPARYGRRKVKTLWRYLVDATNQDTLRAAMAARAGTLADDKGWRQFANSLQTGSDDGTTYAPPPVVEIPKERAGDDEDWETVDDG